MLSFLSRSAAGAGAGAMCALALPPYDLLPAIAGFSVLLWLISATRKLLWAGWIVGLFAFSYHLAGLWWVGQAFLVDAATFGPLMPLAIVGLPLLLTPFYALTGSLIARAPAGAAPRALALCAAVVLAELMRATLFTGFPWNAFGVGLTSSLSLSQSVWLTGMIGLNALSVLIGCLPYLLFARSFVVAGVVAGIGGLMWGYGAVRLANHPPMTADNGEAPIRVIQPNVPQADKWRPENQAAIWSTLLDMTRVADDEQVSLVIWPESAIPFVYREGTAAQPMLADALNGAWLIAGAVAPAEADGFTNSVLVIAPDGSIASRYDKLRLVPFGEFLPFSAVLSSFGFKALVDNANAFVPGQGRAALAVPGFPKAEPLICYEVIFEEAPIEDADWIVNVTNDAWFGDTPGPWQHLRHAQLRAIGQNRPLIRAANTGISAVIDHHGRIDEHLPLGYTGAMNVNLQNFQ